MNFHLKVFSKGSNSWNHQCFFERFRFRIVLRLLLCHIFIHINFLLVSSPLLHQTILYHYSDNNSHLYLTLTQKNHLLNFFQIVSFIRYNSVKLLDLFLSGKLTPKQLLYKYFFMLKFWFVQ